MDGIDLVVHADPPTEHKAYTHRSGRTARAGAEGTVVTVQTAAQVGEVRTLMRKAGVSPQASVAGPGSAVLRDIAGPPAKRVHRPAPARTTAPPGPAAPQPGRGRRVKFLPRPSRSSLSARNSSAFRQSPGSVRKKRI